MPVQAKHRFSVEDYHRMAEFGVLRPGARLELLDGQIIDMSPIGPVHAAVVKRLNEYFSRLAQGRWLMAVQDPLRLDDHSEPEADLMLLKRAPDFYASRHPLPEEVFLLIEVADATLEFDRDEKLPVYGGAGIAEVWIVNLADATVEVYREPHFAGYASRVILRAGDKAKPQGFPDVAVDVAELLKR